MAIIFLKVWLMSPLYAISTYISPQADSNFKILPFNLFFNRAVWTRVVFTNNNSSTYSVQAVKILFQELCYAQYGPNYRFYSDPIIVLPSAPLNVGQFHRFQSALPKCRNLSQLHLVCSNQNLLP